MANDRPLAPGELADDSPAMIAGSIRVVRQGMMGMDDSMRALAESQARIVETQLEILVQLAASRERDHGVDDRFERLEARVAELERTR